jgi:hypothetical protein
VGSAWLRCLSKGRARRGRVWNWSVARGQRRAGVTHRCHAHGAYYIKVERESSRAVSGVVDLKVNGRSVGRPDRRERANRRRRGKGPAPDGANPVRCARDREWENRSALVMGYQILSSSTTHPSDRRMRPHLDLRSTFDFFIGAGDNPRNRGRGWSRVDAELHFGVFIINVEIAQSRNHSRDSGLG